MSSKALTACLALFLMFSLGSGNSLEVTGLNGFGQVYPGSVVSTSVDVEWSGETDAVVSLGSNVSAASTGAEGVNVSFSENPVVVGSGSSKSVGVNVSFDYYLQPDNFTITVYGGTELEKVVESGSDETETVYFGTVESGESGEEKANKSVNESGVDNQTVNDSLDDLNSRVDELLGLLEEQRERNRNLTSRLKSLNNTTGLQSGNLRDAERFPLLWLVVLVAGIFVTAFVVVPRVVSAVEDYLGGESG